MGRRCDRNFICGRYCHVTRHLAFPDNIWQIGTPSGSSAKVRNEGKYDPFPYRYIGYPKVARNLLEMPGSLTGHSHQTNPVATRLLRPRYLCILQAPGEPAVVMKVDDCDAHDTHRTLSYIFIAYTAEQFQSTEDMIALHQIAEAAARNAGVAAYWVGCSCMPEQEHLQEDVRIITIFSCGNCNRF